MMNLGRAKKKLRYFQSEESAPCRLKIKDVFSLRDLDCMFDDLDSEPGTPLLSPLPKRLDDQNKKSSIDSSVTISPRKALDVVAAESDIQLDHLNDKGIPFEEIAPIKTSSPIELLADDGIAKDVEKPEMAPLLFGIEDEEPVVGDLTKSQMNQRSSINVPHGESLPSPPSRIEFEKRKKMNDPVTNSTPLKAPETPDQVCKTSAPEPEKESQTEGSVRLSPILLIKKGQPEPTPKAQPDKLEQEVVVEVGPKQSLFQKKLRNALQPKASGFRKQETLIQPARAPSPHTHEEDFMILEDECPIRFTIPRKPEIKEKPAPESRSVEPDPKEKASPKQPKEAESRKTEPKKKAMAKHGKANDLGIQDNAVESLPETRKPELNEDVGDGEQSSFSPDTNHDADIPVAGKQKPKGKISKPDQHDGKGKNDGGVKIPTEKLTAKSNKYAKLPTRINPGQEEPVPNTKKKVSKIKSAVKADISEPADLGNTKARKQDRSSGKSKKRDKEQEQPAEVPNHTEPPPEPAEEPEDQITSTADNKANKEPASKRCAPKKPGKVKKTNEILEINTLAVPDESAEVSAASKRKRKPPGDWWLSQQNENNMQVQPEEVPSSPELQAKKTQRKASVLTDLSEQEVGMSFQEIQNDPPTVQKLTKTLKKSQANKSRKSHRSADGRRKRKAGTQDQREMTPALMAEEESRDNEASGQLSPLAGSQLSRHCRVNTPGDKRMFDKIYTWDSLSRSAQKSNPVLRDAPERFPSKRQRKPPQNWWKVPQSQEPVESSQSPRNSSPERSRQPVDPSRSVFPQVASLTNTAACGRGRKKNAMTNTPKSVRKSLATFGAIYNSAKLRSPSERGQGAWQKGCRNLLHSLEEHLEQSTEIIPSDHQQQACSHATFDVSKIGESSVARRKSNPRASNRSNRISDFDTAFKSGPSSLIELERYEEDEDTDLPSSKKQFTPRVLSACDLCGPPLKPIVLDNEDWDNLCVWFTHIWPTTSKDSIGISPDDFHWHCHAGRAMGHMVDLQNNMFSNGKILLGSYMKKPAQVDHNAVTVFNVASSCVRVEIDGVKEVYDSGQTFMTPCGQSYSIHNMCQEPAILWYHRMLPNLTLT